MTPSQRSVSVKDVAKQLGLVRDCVYGWIKGRGPSALGIGRLLSGEPSEVAEGARWGGANVDGVPEPGPTPKRGGRK